MPFNLFTRQKAAPLGISCKDFPAELPRAEPDFIPIQNAPARRQHTITRDPARHISMAAEVFVCDGLSASLRGGDEDRSKQTAAKPRIATTDSWLAGEYPSLYLKGAHTEEESISESGEEDEEEPVSPMSSTETLVDAAPAPTAKAAHIAAKLEAIAAEVPRKPVAARVPTLISLADAQARSDIKYRPEGFEMVERLQAKRGEVVWWKAY
ncbi:hypothetical protein PsYK624_133120 [Phanerochaete sordida]|uniref:Uncharacterized protein n=1 Tax=Phanerochaete sordida TaxID=48140 RepID=A0A9P3GLB6_9APHY|nr:hypothetical protein PsYK624_133120 [Phanerochaete sordida]